MMFRGHVQAKVEQHIKGHVTNFKLLHAQWFLTINLLYGML